MRRAAALLALVLVALVVGCGDEPAPSSEQPSAPSLTSYPDIATLHTELVDAGVACGLEYEGLVDEGREVSICIIEGEQALLTVWADPELVAEFLEQGDDGASHVAVGHNWTVDVASAEVASLVAEALGGTVLGGETDPDDLDAGHGAQPEAGHVPAG